MSEHKESVDADHALDEGMAVDDAMLTRTEMLRAAKTARDAFVRLWLEEIRAKEDFLRIPAFEMKVLDSGETVRRPNKALREMFAESWALRIPGDKADARRIFREMEATVEFFQNFTWKGVKGVPKVTKLDLKLRKKLESQPGAKEAVQPYDPVEVAFHKLDEKIRLTADLLSSPMSRAQHEMAVYNGRLDVEMRDAGDTELPHYPFLDCLAAVQEGLDLLDDLRSWGSWTRESGVTFCEWIRRRGGVYKLGDMTDNLAHLSRRAPSASAKPAILIDKIEMWRTYPNGVVLPNHPEKTSDGWGWYSKRGFYRMNLRWYKRELARVLGRAASEEETIPVFPKRARVSISSMEKRSKVRVIPIRVTDLGAKLSMRIAFCSHCSGRIQERDDPYWSLIEGLGDKMPSKRRVFCTQFRESGEFGAATLFVKDEFDMTSLQRKLLGDVMFEDSDTWKIQGKTGEYRCLLCGRTKFFRTRTGVAVFTRRKYLQDFDESNTGRLWFQKDRILLGMEEVRITFTVAGEQFSRQFENRFVQS